MQTDAWSAGGAEAVAEGGPVAGLAEGHSHSDEVGDSSR